MFAPMRYSLTYGGVASQRPKVPITSVVAGEVCATCNNGWMSDLECAAFPLLTSRPQRGPMSVDAATTLARWFVKTAIAINVSMPYRLVFDASTRHAVRYGLPPNVVVSLARVRRQNGHFDQAQGMVIGGFVPTALIGHPFVDEVLARTYSAYIRVGDLVGTVILFPPPVTPENFITDSVRIWPAAGRLPYWSAIPVFADYTSDVVLCNLTVGLGLPFWKPRSAI